MKLRRVILFSIFLFFTCQTYSQQYRYFKNFDFKKICGVDILPDINALPDFYVQCEYNTTGKLIGFYTVTKLTWDAFHNKRYYPIVEQNGRTFLFLGSGKQRAGYTRGLFQKKVFTSDSALIIHDTLIYKTTRQGHITIQFYTNIGNDTVQYKEMSFTFASSKELKNSILSSYAFYKNWFSLSESAYFIVEGAIKLKSDTILVWNVIKSKSFNN